MVLFFSFFQFYLLLSSCQRPNDLCFLQDYINSTCICQYYRCPENFSIHSCSNALTGCYHAELLWCTFLYVSDCAEANVIYEAERCSGTFKEHMIIRRVTGTRGKVTPTNTSPKHLRETLDGKFITTSLDTLQIQSCCFFQYEAILLQTVVSSYLHLHYQTKLFLWFHEVSLHCLFYLNSDGLLLILPVGA